jgi:hypothetical protein
MIMRGNSITKPDDPLQAATLEQLYKHTLQPREELANLINQLRIVKTLDALKYRRLKTQLPYIVCGTYNPPFRKTENFAHTQCFVVDLDHLSDKEMDIESLKDRLKADPRVALLFISPGNDGLKVVFKLDEKCYDAAKFKLFYKSFAKSLAMQYQLHQVLDERTSDVTRACFLSHDPNAYYNTDAQCINIETFVNFADYAEVKDLFAEISEGQKAEKALERDERPLPGDDVLATIKAKLNPKEAKRKEKIIVMPSELNSLEADIKEYLKEFPIELLQIENIHYGKKILFAAGLHKAEINVFYGKKGYSVVATTKTGTHAELAKLCHQLLSEMLL